VIFLEQKKETGSDKNITELNHYFVAWKGRNNYSDTHTQKLISNMTLVASLIIG